MEKVQQKIKGLVFSQTSKDTVILFTGNALSSVLAIVFTILAARYLGPEDFSLASALVSFVAIMVAVGDLGLGSSLFGFVSRFWSHEQFDQARRVLRTIFSLRTFSAAVIGLILIVFSKPLTKLIFKVDQPSVIILSSLAIIGSMFLEFQIQNLQSQKKFKLATVFLPLSNLVRLGFLFIFQLTGSLNLVNAILAFVLGPAIAFLISLIWERMTLTLSFKELSRIKKIAPFAAWMGVNKIIGSINGRLDILLLVQLLTPFQTGIYAAVKQFAWGIPIALGSFATVLAPRFASLEKKKLALYLKKSLILSGLIGLLIGIGVLIAPFLVTFLGEKYQTATPVLQTLLIAFIPLALSAAPVNLLVYAFRKPVVIAIQSIIFLPIIVLGNIYFAPRIGVYAPVLMQAISNLGSLVVSSVFAVWYWKKIK